MASVNFKKNTYTGGAAMIAHFTRHDGEDVEYRNKYVDKSRSADNYVIGGPRFGPDPTTSELLAKLKARVETIDREIPPKRKVKDRVTVMTYNVPAPEGLSPEREQRFFEIAYAEIARMSGGVENVTPGYVHRDEIHDYIDARSGEHKTSRSHLQMAGVPYTPEKGVNGKAFETRARMAALNKAIDDRCRHELGCRFVTGEKGLTGQTVEELQAASVSKAKKLERERFNAENRALKEENAALKVENGALEADNGALRAALVERRLQVEAAEKAAQRAQERARDAAAAEDRARAAVGKLEASIDDLEREKTRLQRLIEPLKARFERVMSWVEQIRNISFTMNPSYQELFEKAYQDGRDIRDQDTRKQVHDRDTTLR